MKERAAPSGFAALRSQLRLNVWRQWQADRLGRSRASAFVDVLLAEPPDADVRWLAERATGDDRDHARWELRYARRAAGMLAARRDALDDRTASLVTAALARAVRRDPLVASGRREIAARQFNTRLAAYSEALADKNAKERTGDRLGRVLLGFAGRLDPSVADLAAGGSIVAGYLAGASEALRRAFGEASLPEDVAPSRVRGSRH